MEKEKFKYFISYVVDNKEFYNDEIIRDNFIESSNDIFEIENELKQGDMNKVTIINYRIF
jgi:hypothetical protein